MYCARGHVLILCALKFCRHSFLVDMYSPNPLSTGCCYKRMHLFLSCTITVQISAPLSREHAHLLSPSFSIVIRASVPCRHPRIVRHGSCLRSKRVSRRIRRGAALHLSLALEHSQFSFLLCPFQFLSLRTEVQHNSTSSRPLDIHHSLCLGSRELLLGGLGWCCLVG
jgi:hypothetical protein